jgi:hypothetical protein
MSEGGRKGRGEASRPFNSSTYMSISFSRVFILFFLLSNAKIHMRHFCVVCI